MRKQKLLLPITCIIFSLVNVLGLGITYSISMLMEAAEKAKLELLYSRVGLTIVMLLAYIGCSILSEFFRQRFLAYRELGIKSRIMQSILMRPISAFLQKDDAYFLNLLTTDVELYRNDALRSLPNIASSFTSIVVAEVLLYRIHKYLFLASLLLCGIPLALDNLFTKRTQMAKDRFSKKAEQHANVLKEIIQGNETIRSNRSEGIFLSRYENAAKERQQAFARSEVLNCTAMNFFYGVAMLMQIACVGVGGYFVIRGEMAVSMLFAAMNYYVAVSNHLCNLVAYGIDIRSVRNIKEKLQQEEETREEKQELEIANAGELSYENVGFAYGDHVILKDMSVRFKKGGRYGIVGESGIGKSTLIKLFLKYYEEYEGKIQLGNEDIRNLSEQQLYQEVGFVQQSPYLFNASLRENITMFSDEADVDMVRYASILEEVNLTKLAERVKEQPLGDFGDNISGGERQRIQIARVLYRNPSIVFFDEPTTGLDPENVKLIWDIILKPSETIHIVVTHDWSPHLHSRFTAIYKLSNGILIEG